jgi:hypothetical protein
MKNYIKIVFTSIVLLTSCSKDSLEVCGVIEGGGSRFNPSYAFPEYYFKINGNKEWVDELTYLSFSVGDYICLE